MKVPRKAIAQVIEVVIEGGSKQATLLLDEKTKVTATAIKKGQGMYMLTIGRPNFRERLHIKKSKANRESFRKIIIKDFKKAARKTKRK